MGSCGAGKRLPCQNGRRSFFSMGRASVFLRFLRRFLRPASAFSLCSLRALLRRAKGFAAAAAGGARWRGAAWALRLLRSFLLLAFPVAWRAPGRGAARGRFSLALPRLWRARGCGASCGRLCLWLSLGRLACGCCWAPCARFFSGACCAGADALPWRSGRAFCSGACCAWACARWWRGWWARFFLALAVLGRRARGCGADGGRVFFWRLLCWGRARGCGAAGGRFCFWRLLWWGARAAVALWLGARAAAALWARVFSSGACCAGACCVGGTHRASRAVLRRGVRAAFFLGGAGAARVRGVAMRVARKAGHARRVFCVVDRSQF